MLNNMEERKPEPEYDPPDHGSDDDRQTQNTSMKMNSHNTTNSSLDDKLKFDNNGSRYIPYTEIKHPTYPRDSVRDDLPPYVFRSKAKLFIGVWHDTTESPCIEIIEDIYEIIDGLLITCATEENYFLCVLIALK